LNFTEKEDLKEFLEKKIQVENQTALHFAAKTGSEAIVECLITEYGVNTDALDHQNRTALFIAAEYSKTEFYRFKDLKKKFFNINETDKKKIVTLLLSLKCNVSFINENKVLYNKMGQTALVSIVAKMPDIVSLSIYLVNIN
jgi:ankyrin repeat protein